MHGVFEFAVVEFQYAFFKTLHDLFKLGIVHRRAADVHKGFVAFADEFFVNAHFALGFGLFQQLLGLLVRHFFVDNIGGEAAFPLHGGFAAVEHDLVVFGFKRAARLQQRFEKILEGFFAFGSGHAALALRFKQVSQNFKGFGIQVFHAQVVADLFQLNVLLRIALQAEIAQFAAAGVHQFAVLDCHIGAAFQIVQAHFKGVAACHGKGNGFHFAAGFACCEHGEGEPVGLVAGVFDGAVKFRVFERDAGDVDFQVVHFPAVFAVFERERGGDGLPCKRAAVFGE